MLDAARVILDKDESVDQYDTLRIKIVSAFDIGIASSRFAVYDGQPPAVWRARAASRSAAR